MAQAAESDFRSTGTDIEGLDNALVMYALRATVRALRCSVRVMVMGWCRHAHAAARGAERAQGRRGRRGVPNVGACEGVLELRCA